MTDPIDQFRQIIESSGLTPPNVILDDGVIHRFSTNGKARDDSGWYSFRTDGIPAGAFGCWRTDMQSTWCAKSDTTMTQAERDTHRQRIKAMQAQREAEKLQRQQSAATEAAQRLAAATACTQHAYLTAKGVQGHSVKVDSAGALIVPMRDAAGTLHSLQTITPDGDKRFLFGGLVKGCYHAIGKPAAVLIVCEGYATGASIHECTGQAVAVAFNAGNLGTVAVALHKKYPELTIVIAADDDWCTDGNPGLASAKSAALAVGGFVVVPQFPADRPNKATDFNDLAAMAGPSAVRACFSEYEVLSC
jgi:putative DNA primase/helicase